MINIIQFQTTMTLCRTKNLIWAININTSHNNKKIIKVIGLKDTKTLSRNKNLIWATGSHNWRDRKPQVGEFESKSARRPLDMLRLAQIQIQIHFYTNDWIQIQIPQVGEVESRSTSGPLDMLRLAQIQIQIQDHKYTSAWILNTNTTCGWI